MTAESTLEIFISYRRDDSSGYAGRLHDALQARFGEQHVFMDVATIEPGLDFLDAIERGIERSDVFLPVIGRRWSSIQDAQGRPRLESPTDPVRLETEVALQREGLRIIPVLVDGAVMPSADELPDTLAKLARRNAHELSHSRWHYDVEQLMMLLDRIRGQAAGQLASAAANHSTVSASRRRNWSWEEYERDSAHSRMKLRLIRALADQITSATDWTTSFTSYAIDFRSQGRSVLAIQFWSQSVVRLTIPDIHERPSPDPLPPLSGYLGKRGQWSWYLPADGPAPDIADVIRYVTERISHSSREEAPASASTVDSDAGPAQDFETGMYSAYEHLKTTRGYNATYFLQLLRERGGVGTAQRLLQSSDHYSDGFLRLVELNELHHSVEAHVLRPEFRELFTDVELSEARRRLRAADFDIDRWEEQPWA